MKFLFFITAIFMFFQASQAQAEGQVSDQIGDQLAAETSITSDVLVKFKSHAALMQTLAIAVRSGVVVEQLGFGNWAHMRVPEKGQSFFSVASLKNNANVAGVQPNFKIHLIENEAHAGLYSDPNFLIALKSITADPTPAVEMKPALPVILNSSGGAGVDPLFKNQWGMQDIGVKNAWKQARGKGMIVAVIDSGVDYSHEDLIDNMWRNQGEMGFDDQGHNKSNNGIDDDGNGYVDDVMAWDFADNDNKPYDVHGQLLDVILKGENPGHGTHCAGNIAARADNGKGTAGVAPEAQIMPLRFINKAGQGTTANAIKAIVYAMDNGAKVLSNSWGSEGEDPKEAGDNAALKEIIASGQQKGVLFVFAAGNGHKGIGYDNDSDPKPAVPASYAIENIVSVAAIGKDNKLGAFSNWGLHSVHLAAPGVQVYSTTVGNTYADTIIDIFGFKATWDGTSMAAPHVAGALALYWSKHPEANWKDVKKALLDSTTPVDSMKGRSISGGKLNVEKLLAL